MGFSLELLKKECLVLSLEVDKDIRIEIGTGWDAPKGVSLSVMMQISLQELGEIIKDLQEIKEKLDNSKICQDFDCHTYNPQDATRCNACNLLL
jgi:ribosomal protein L40E